MIELIEMCNTKEESMAREGFYQRTTVCVNKRIENRTLQEYRESHKEETAVTKKAYRESHKDEIVALDKAYRESHKEQRAASNKAYYETHKEEMAVYAKDYRSNQVNRDKINTRRRALRAERKASVKSG